MRGSENARPHTSDLAGECGARSRHPAAAVQGNLIVSVDAGTFKLGTNLCCVSERAVSQQPGHRHVHRARNMPSNRVDRLSLSPL